MVYEQDSPALRCPKRLIVDSRGGVPPTPCSIGVSRHRPPPPLLPYVLGQTPPTETPGYATDPRRFFGHGGYPVRSFMPKEPQIRRVPRPLLGCSPPPDWTRPRIAEKWGLWPGCGAPGCQPVGSFGPSGPHDFRPSIPVTEAQKITLTPDPAKERQCHYSFRGL